MINNLKKLETITTISPKELVKERLKQNGKLSFLIYETLNQTYHKWKQNTETQNFINTLKIHERICQLDFILAQEIASCGGQKIINELMRMILINDDCVNVDDDDEEDTTDVEMIRELCFSISSFSLMNSQAQTLIAFDNDELFSRLPLVYNLPKFADSKLSTFEEYNDDDSSDSKMDNDDSAIFINQVTQIRQSAQEDVGFGKNLFLLRIPF